MSQGSTKLSWVTRSKEILEIAQNRIDELNKALRFEQQLRDEEQKKLDELADENDYEKRLDQLWVVNQIDERIEHIAMRCSFRRRVQKNPSSWRKRNWIRRATRAR